MIVDVKKETVGKVALDLLHKGDQKQGVIDTQRAMQRNYVDSLVEAAKIGEDKIGKEKPFYVCVQTRRERLLSNVIRSQFYVRQTRPIPQYDLALYWYDPKTEELRFVWCVPDKETVDRLVIDPLSAAPDEQELLRFCMSFKNNTLV